MSLSLARVWRVLLEISSFLAFCWSWLLGKSFHSLERTILCFPQLVTQSGRVLSLEHVSFSTEWVTLCFPQLNTQLGRVLMPSWLSISCLFFVFCFCRRDFINSGKGFISSGSSIWFVIIFCELFSNIPSASSISFLPGDSLIPAGHGYSQVSFL